MTDSANTDFEPIAALQAIADGAVMRQIGMTPEVLRLGLVVAHNHMQRGAFDEAFSVYSSLVICNPRDVDFQIGLSNCCLALGQWALALQSASLAIGLAPRDSRGYLLSGRACIGLKVIPEARADLEQAIRYAEEARQGDIAAEARKLAAMLETAQVSAAS